MKTLPRLFIPFFLTLCLFSKVQAQFTSRDITYGGRFPSRSFYQQFNTLENFQLYKPLQTVGIAVTGHYFVNKRGDPDGYSSYCQILPQDIVVQDSIKCRVNGFVFGFMLFGRDVFKKMDHFDFIICTGFNTGRLRLEHNELIRRKNAFFSPAVAAVPRLRIGRLVLSARFEYEYDISSPRWKKFLFAKDGGITLSNLRQNGLSTCISLGWTIKEKLNMSVNY